MANLNNFDLYGHLKPQSDTTDEQIRTVVSEIVTRHIDITAGYENWINVAFALKDAMGEAGRPLFHELSRMNKDYDYNECDKKYTSCMKGSGSGVHIASFFKMAKDAGIDISQVARCANNANMPTGTNTQKVAKNAENAFLQDYVSSGNMAQLAQNTFSDKLKRENLPSYLWPVYDNQSDAVGRDKMLLGTLCVLSGLIPESLYSIYDRRKVYSPIYTIIYGRFATSKGDLEAVRQIAIPLKNEMRREYEAQKKEFDQAMADWEAKGKKEHLPQPKEPISRSPFIYANSSAAVVYRDLDANDGWGIIFDTEADTLTNMLSKSEYGDYSDLLRKAHHHEGTPYKRVAEHIDIELANPRLAVFLTGTGSQLPLLLPPGNISNGLASRFLFYALPDNKLEFRNVFEGKDEPIGEIYYKLGEQFMPMYHALEMRKDNPVQFSMSIAQQKEFVTTFNDILHEQFYMLGDGIQGFVLRIALECFRYAMVLSVLRCLSEWDRQTSLFEDEDRVLPCDDRDFQTAMTIINCLVNHTGRVYAVIASKDDDPFRKAGMNPSPEVKRFYEALPAGREIKSAEVKDIAKQLNISERTVFRLLGEMIGTFQVLERPKHGVYFKPLPKVENE